MARKNPKIFRQNGDGPDQKGLRSPACGAELPRFRVDKDGSQGDRLTPTRCTRPQGRVRIETAGKSSKEQGDHMLHSPSGAGED